MIDYVKSKDHMLDPLTKVLTRDGVKRSSKEMDLPSRTIHHDEVVRDAHDIVAIWNDHVIKAMQFPFIESWGYLYPKTIAVCLEPCHVSRYPNSSYDSMDFSQSCDSGKPHDLSQLSDISNIPPVNRIQVPTVLIEYPPDKGHSQAVLTRGTILTPLQLGQRLDPSLAITAYMWFRDTSSSPAVAVAFQSQRHIRTRSSEARDANPLSPERYKSRGHVASHGHAQGRHRTRGSTSSKDSTRGLSLEPQLFSSLEGYPVSAPGVSPALSMVPLFIPEVANGVSPYQIWILLLYRHLNMMAWDQFTDDTIQIASELLERMVMGQVTLDDFLRAVKRHPLDDYDDQGDSRDIREADGRPNRDRKPP
ncbi:hypothetical protein FXO37_34959 [Capsicum annuum]|nr:hypothetical protein FXO37_34959 [Capsicum annuum]